MSSTYPLKAVFVLFFAFSLTACQTPPSQPEPVHPGPVDTGEPVDSAPEAEPVEETVAEPEVALPACPEPEPVPEPVCPPPPAPKPCPVCPGDKFAEKMLLGAIEKVRLEPPGVTYTARIDSGAEGSSVHATNIVRFERDGDNWVRFELDQGDEGSIVMEREVVRRVLVRQASVDEVERRVKVLMNLSIGSYSDLIEFSLNDRSEMEYPVLLGRNFLRNNAVVDVSEDYIAK